VVGAKGRAALKVGDGAMELTIREATAADYAAIGDIFAEADDLHRQHLPHIFQKPPGPAREQEYILGLLADESVGLFLAQLGGQVVGLVCVLARAAPAVPMFVPRRYANVDSLVVQQGFRRRGIGRALMERVQAWAQDKGLDHIELHVWDFNQEAIAFYQQLGYENLSRRMGKRLDKQGGKQHVTPTL
jgi:ribosomal protein S18 acetylase RimI-like enzyme